MTHHTDILGRAPIMQQMQATEPESPTEDWRGMHLIKTPKPEPEPEPEVIETRQKMHFTARRRIVADLHAQGMTAPEMADKLDAPTDTIYLDHRALDLTPHPVNKKQPVVGDEDKARETFRAFCKRHKITQAQFRDTKKIVPGMADLRARCLVEIKEAAGASIRLLAKVTGIQEQTARMALRRVKRNPLDAPTAPR